MLKKTIRVMGCGNLWMGDDGVGVRAVEKMLLMQEKAGAGAMSDPIFFGFPEPPLPLLKEVDIIDAGVSGLDMLCFLEGFDKIIIIDAIKSNERFGSILKIKGEDLLIEDGFAGMMSSHDVSVPTVLNIAKEIQGLPEIVVFGIEINKIGPVVDLSDELSPEIEKTIDRVISFVLEEIQSEKCL
jgi:hydrogenase maturation protease